MLNYKCYTFLQIGFFCTRQVGTHSVQYLCAVDTVQMKYNMQQVFNVKRKIASSLSGIR